MKQRLQQEARPHAGVELGESCPVAVTVSHGNMATVTITFFSGSSKSENGWVSYWTIEGSSASLASSTAG